MSGLRERAIQLACDLDADRAFDVEALESLRAAVERVAPELSRVELEQLSAAWSELIAAAEAYKQRLQIQLGRARSGRRALQGYAPDRVGRRGQRLFRRL